MSQLEKALDRVAQAASELFEADHAVRSVGVGADGNGFAYVAVRNASVIVPFVAGKTSAPTAFEGIPIRYQNSLADPDSLMRVPHYGPGSPGEVSMVPEQRRHRPLVCGLQVQNLDDDFRSGQVNAGFITIGTLGCFVQVAGQGLGILSNNHVLAAENRGVIGDRILQPGGSNGGVLEDAKLFAFELLVTSPAGATIAAGTVNFNDIDAATAVLAPHMQGVQAYLSFRQATAPKGAAAVSIGDRVHKVGRTTGLTFGIVTQVGTIVGPVNYSAGSCWFRDSFVIEGVNGATFSDRGDSGSAIVRDSDGMVLGLLYAGNGTQTYACPIAPVLSRLNCAIA